MFSNPHVLFPSIFPLFFMGNVIVMLRRQKCPHLYFFLQKTARQCSVTKFHVIVTAPPPSLPLSFPEVTAGVFIPIIWHHRQGKWRAAFWTKMHSRRSRSYIHYLILRRLTAKFSSVPNEDRLCAPEASGRTFAMRTGEPPGPLTVWSTNIVWIIYKN